MDGLAAESFGVYTAAVSVRACWSPAKGHNPELTEKSTPRAQRHRCDLALAELVDPAGEEGVAGGFDVDEFDAHANARLHDADDGKAFDVLTLA